MISWTFILLSIVHRWRWNEQLCQWTGISCRSHSHWSDCIQFCESIGSFNGIDTKHILFFCRKRIWLIDFYRGNHVTFDRELKYENGYLNVLDQDTWVAFLWNKWSVSFFFCCSFSNRLLNFAIWMAICKCSSAVVICLCCGLPVCRDFGMQIHFAATISSAYVQCSYLEWIDAVRCFIKYILVTKVTMSKQKNRNNDHHSNLTNGMKVNN